VDDDARHGRVYLPAAWLREREVIIVPGTPLAAETRVRVAPVVARLLDEADRYYASAWHGVARLPWRSAWSVATARHVYADIGHAVRRRGPSAWDARVVVSKGRKIARLAQALAESVWAVSVNRSRPAPPRHGLWTPPSGGHASLHHDACRHLHGAVVGAAGHGSWPSAQVLMRALWFLHRSHHVPHAGWFEWNDLFGLFFAVPSIVLIHLGVRDGSWMLPVGLGMTGYGVIYFLFHDVVVHRRVRLRGVPQWPYLRHIIMAHLVHHGHMAVRARSRSTSSTRLPM
jgi:hypothetical protein